VFVKILLIPLFALLKIEHMAFTTLILLKIELDWLHTSHEWMIGQPGTEGAAVMLLCCNGVTNTGMVPAVASRAGRAMQYDSPDMQFVRFTLLKCLQ
jgi:hypothetical protein